jgi:hypothetical protein
VKRYKSATILGGGPPGKIAQCQSFLRDNRLKCLTRQRKKNIPLLFKFLDLLTNFIGFLGRQFSPFAYGCYNGVVDGVRTGEEQPIPNAEQVSIHLSEVDQTTIEKVLQSNDSNKIMDQIDEVCAQEELSKLGCVQAAYYCSKVILKGTNKLIPETCMNLLA